VKNLSDSRTRRRATLALWALPLALVLFAPAARAQNPKPSLDQVLLRMDESGKRLRTLSAELSYTKVTVLVDDHSTETGQIFFRKGDSPFIRIQIEKPEEKTILVRGSRAELFYPKINQIQEYSLDDHAGLIQQFFLLGFGTDIAELRKAYTLKPAGEEKLDGQATTVLELTPRQQKVANQVEKVHLWVNPESGLPVQQKFFQPGGDYMIARYSAVRVNRQLPGSTFQLQGARNAKRIKMN
jgi:outer membrane lipoprotein-sorting protein